MNIIFFKYKFHFVLKSAANFIVLIGIILVDVGSYNEPAVEGVH